MLLRWIDPEVMTIPDVGQVHPGTQFSIEDNKALDLLQRKVAEKVELPAVKEIPISVPENKVVKTMIQKDDAKSEKE